MSKKAFDKIAGGLLDADALARIQKLIDAAEREKVREQKEWPGNGTPFLDCRINALKEAQALFGKMHENRHIGSSLDSFIAEESLVEKIAEALFAEDERERQEQCDAVGQKFQPTSKRDYGVQITHWHRLARAALQVIEKK